MKASTGAGSGLSLLRDVLRAGTVAGLAMIPFAAGFYVALNSLLLPLAFGDPTPWSLGWQTIYPSLTIHLVYGVVLAWTARSAAR